MSDSALNIITLENLHEKLPQWRPEDKSHLYAIVDMGSNGIRFSITSMKPPSTRLLEPIYSTRAAISLFDSLQFSADGPVFSSDTLKNVASTLSTFRQLAITHGVPQSQIVILATEAVRRAQNRDQMLEAIALATEGLEVQVLDPKVETLFGAVMGSRSGLRHVSKGGLFLDLGGGSLQMTWVDTSDNNYDMDAARAGGSLPYGAARLTQLLQQTSAAARAMDIISPLQDGIARIYADLCAKSPTLRAIRDAHHRGQDASVDVYMCGGGLRGYGSMLMHNDPISPYPIPSADMYSVPGCQFKQPTKMRQVNDQYAGKIFGMSKRRRRQFPAIATVVEAFIAVVPNIHRVTFCGGSNRQGYLMMKMPREIRESDPLQVLANVKESEKPIFDAILGLLSASFPSTPSTEPRLQHVPSVLGPGLGPLFIRRIWARAGHSTTSNSSYALHDALIRDPDCPGLTHLSRALLAVTHCARWGNDIGPADEPLHKGFVGIIESHHEDATFWVLYVGAVANILATVCPVMPTDVDSFLSTIKLSCVLSNTKTDENDVELVISLSNDAAKRVNLDDLADTIKKTTKLKAYKSKFKASARFISHP
ncbi:hypothetical protein E4U43_004934 [Claviceps pusilla]|uniref:Ppx/GppA phosphatase domain-containing protein n=1 Tax=Claviceps pusilla TaxID=123648 RepID=A0A9P7N3F8_9HYPO|nr:hypothetical protein E4U43_004934 [Claviceps pusilla]